MPHAVFLRGVNVGGRNTFRPSALAKRLAGLEARSIGVAATSRNWNTIVSVGRALGVAP